MFYHLRRIGPAASLPIAVDHMVFWRPVSIIGRSKVDAHFIIDSSNPKKSLYISRLHARVVRHENEEHKIYDDSRNGIFINNIKIDGSAVLHEGDTVTFGHHNGEPIPPGTRCRQPGSEYQFIFERCTCPRSQSLDNPQQPRQLVSMTLTTQREATTLNTRQYNTDIVVRQRSATPPPTNNNNIVICNRPVLVEMSTDGIHDSLINNNLPTDLPTAMMSCTSSYMGNSVTASTSGFSTIPLSSLTNVIVGQMQPPQSLDSAQFVSGQTQFLSMPNQSLGSVYQTGFSTMPPPSSTLSINNNGQTINSTSIVMQEAQRFSTAQPTEDNGNQLYNVSSGIHNTCNNDQQEDGSSEMIDENGNTNKTGEEKVEDDESSKRLSDESDNVDEDDNDESMSKLEESSDQSNDESSHSVSEEDKITSDMVEHRHSSTLDEAENFEKSENDLDRPGVYRSDSQEYDNINEFEDEEEHSIGDESNSAGLAEISSIKGSEPSVSRKTEDNENEPMFHDLDLEELSNDTDDEISSLLDDDDDDDSGDDYQIEDDKRCSDKSISEDENFEKDVNEISDEDEKNQLDDEEKLDKSMERDDTESEEEDDEITKIKQSFRNLEGLEDNVKCPEDMKDENSDVNVSTDDVLDKDVEDQGKENCDEEEFVLEQENDGKDLANETLEKTLYESLHSSDAAAADENLEEGDVDDNVVLEKEDACNDCDEKPHQSSDEEHDDKTMKTDDMHKEDEKAKNVESDNDIANDDEQLDQTDVLCDDDDNKDDDVDSRMNKDELNKKFDDTEEHNVDEKCSNDNARFHTRDDDKIDEKLEEKRLPKDNETLMNNNNKDKENDGLSSQEATVDENLDNENKDNGCDDQILEDKDDVDQISINQTVEDENIVEDETSVDKMADENQFKHNADSDLNDGAEEEGDDKISLNQTAIGDKNIVDAETSISKMADENELNHKSDFVLKEEAKDQCDDQISVVEDEGGDETCLSKMEDENEFDEKADSDLNNEADDKYDDQMSEEGLLDENGKEIHELSDQESDSSYESEANNDITNYDIISQNSNIEGDLMVENPEIEHDLEDEKHFVELENQNIRERSFSEPESSSQDCERIYKLIDIDAIRKWEATQYATISQSSETSHSTEASPHVDVMSPCQKSSPQTEMRLSLRETSPVKERALSKQVGTSQKEWNSPFRENSLQNEIVSSSQETPSNIEGTSFCKNTSFLMEKTSPCKKIMLPGDWTAATQETMLKEERIPDCQNEATFDGQGTLLQEEGISDGQEVLPQQQGTSDGQEGLHQGEGTSDGQEVLHQQQGPSDRQEVLHQEERTPDGQEVLLQHEGTTDGQEVLPQQEGTSGGQEVLPQQEGTSDGQEILPQQQGTSDSQEVLHLEERTSDAQEVLLQQEGTTEGQEVLPQQEGTSDGQEVLPQQEGTTEGQEVLPQQEGTSDSQEVLPQQEGTSDGQEVSSQQEGTSEGQDTLLQEEGAANCQDTLLQEEGTVYCQKYLPQKEGTLDVIETMPQEEGTSGGIETLPLKELTSDVIEMIPQKQENTDGQETMPQENGTAEVLETMLQEDKPSSCQETLPQEEGTSDGVETMRQTEGTSDVIETLPKEEGTSDVIETLHQEEGTSDVIETLHQEEGTSDVIETLPQVEMSLESLETMPQEKGTSDDLETTPQEEVTSDGLKTTLQEEMTSDSKETVPKGKGTLDDLETQPQEEVTSDGLKTTPQEEMTSDGKETVPQEKVTSGGQETLFKEQFTSDGIEALPQEDMTLDGVKTLPQEDMTSYGVKTLPQEDMTSDGVKTLPQEDMTSDGQKTLPQEDMTSDGVKTLPQEDMTSDGQETLFQEEEMSSCQEISPQAEVRLHNKVEGKPYQGTSPKLEEDNTFQNPLLQTDVTVTVEEPVASQTSEPVASQTSEPVASQTSEPGDSQTSEPGASQTSEPVASQTSEPVAFQTSEPGDSQTSEPVASQTSEPVTSQTSEPVASQTSEPVASQTSEPVASQTSEPVASQTSEPVTSQTSGPVASQTSEPVTSQTSEPVASQTSEPVASQTSEPVASQTSEPVASQTSEPVTSQTSGPVASQTSEPVASQTSEPVASQTSEPVASQTSGPVASQTSVPVTSQTSEPGDLEQFQGHATPASNIDQEDDFRLHQEDDFRLHQEDDFRLHQEDDFRLHQEDDFRLHQEDDFRLHLESDIEEDKSENLQEVNTKDDNLDRDNESIHVIDSQNENSQKINAENEHDKKSDDDIKNYQVSNIEDENCLKTVKEKDNFIDYNFRDGNKDIDHIQDENNENDNFLENVIVNWAPVGEDTHDAMNGNAPEDTVVIDEDMQDEKMQENEGLISDSTHDTENNKAVKDGEIAKDTHVIMFENEPEVEILIAENTHDTMNENVPEKDDLNGEDIHDTFNENGTENEGLVDKETQINENDNVPDKEDLSDEDTHDTVNKSGTENEGLVDKETQINENVTEDEYLTTEDTHNVLNEEKENQGLVAEYLPCGDMHYADNVKESENEGLVTEDSHNTDNVNVTKDEFVKSVNLVECEQNVDKKLLQEDQSLNDTTTDHSLKSKNDPTVSFKDCTGSVDLVDSKEALIDIETTSLPNVTESPKKTSVYSDGLIGDENPQHSYVDNSVQNVDETKQEDATNSTSLSNTSESASLTIVNAHDKAVQGNLNDDIGNQVPVSLEENCTLDEFIEYKQAKEEIDLSSFPNDQELSLDKPEDEDISIQEHEDEATYGEPEIELVSSQDMNLDEHNEESEPSAHYESTERDLAKAEEIKLDGSNLADEATVRNEFVDDQPEADSANPKDTAINDGRQENEVTVQSESVDDQTERDLAKAGKIYLNGGKQEDSIIDDGRQTSEAHDKLPKTNAVDLENISKDVPNTTGEHQIHEVGDLPETNMFASERTTLDSKSTDEVRVQDVDHLPKTDLAKPEDTTLNASPKTNEGDDVCVDKVSERTENPEDIDTQSSNNESTIHDVDILPKTTLSSSADTAVDVHNSADEVMVHVTDQQPKRTNIKGSTIDVKYTTDETTVNDKDHLPPTTNSEETAREAQTLPDRTSFHDADPKPDTDAVSSENASIDAHDLTDEVSIVNVDHLPKTSPESMTKDADNFPIEVNDVPVDPQPKTASVHSDTREVQNFTDSVNSEVLTGNLKDDRIKGHDVLEVKTPETASITRKRKLSNDDEVLSDELPSKRPAVHGLVADMVTGFFGFRTAFKKGPVDRKVLKRNLVKKYVKHFFHQISKANLRFPKKKVGHVKKSFTVDLDKTSLIENQAAESMTVQATTKKGEFHTGERNEAVYFETSTSSPSHVEHSVCIDMIEEKDDKTTDSGNDQEQIIIVDDIENEDEVIHIDSEESEHHTDAGYDCLEKDVQTGSSLEDIIDLDMVESGKLLLQPDSEVQYENVVIGQEKISEDLMHMPENDNGSSPRDNIDLEIVESGLDTNEMSSQPVSEIGYEDVVIGPQMMIEDSLLAHKNDNVSSQTCDLIDVEIKTSSLDTDGHKPAYYNSDDTRSSETEKCINSTLDANREKQSSEQTDDYSQDKDISNTKPDNKSVENTMESATQSSIESNPELNPKSNSEEDTMEFADTQMSTNSMLERNQEDATRHIEECGNNKISKELPDVVENNSSEDTMGSVDTQMGTKHNQDDASSQVEDPSNVNRFKSTPPFMTQLSTSSLENSSEDSCSILLPYRDLSNDPVQEHTGLGEISDGDNENGKTGENIDETGKTQSETGNIEDETGKAQSETGNIEDETGKTQSETGNIEDETGEKLDETGDKLDGICESQDETDDKLDEISKSQDETGDKLDGICENQDESGDKLDETGENSKDISAAKQTESDIELRPSIPWEEKVTTVYQVEKTDAFVTDDFESEQRNSRHEVVDSKKTLEHGLENMKDAKIDDYESLHTNISYEVVESTKEESLDLNIEDVKSVTEDSMDTNMEPVNEKMDKIIKSVNEKIQSKTIHEESSEATLMEVTSKNVGSLDNRIEETKSVNAIDEESSDPTIIDAKLVKEGSMDTQAESIESGNDESSDGSIIDVPFDKEDESAMNVGDTTSGRATDGESSEGTIIEIDTEDCLDTQAKTFDSCNGESSEGTIVDVKSSRATDDESSEGTVIEFENEDCLDTQAKSVESSNGESSEGTIIELEKEESLDTNTVDAKTIIPTDIESSGANVTTETKSVSAGGMESQKHDESSIEDGIPVKTIDKGRIEDGVPVKTIDEDSLDSNGGCEKLYTAERIYDDMQEDFEIVDDEESSNEGVQLGNGTTGILNDEECELSFEGKFTQDGSKDTIEEGGNNEHCSGEKLNEMERENMTKEETDETHDSSDDRESNEETMAANKWKESIQKEVHDFFSRSVSEDGSSHSEIERSRNPSESHTEKLYHSTYTLPDFDVSPDTSMSRPNRSRNDNTLVNFPEIDVSLQYDSDSLPEVQFLRASPAKYIVVKKEEKSGDDSGLESGLDVVEKADDVSDLQQDRLVLADVKNRLHLSIHGDNLKDKTVVDNLKDVKSLEKYLSKSETEISSSLESYTAVQECITPVKKTRSQGSTPLKLKLKNKGNSEKKKILKKKKCSPKKMVNRASDSEDDFQASQTKYASPLKLLSKKGTNNETPEKKGLLRNSDEENVDSPSRQVLKRKAKTLTEASASKTPTKTNLKRQKLTKNSKSTKPNRKATTNKVNMDNIEICTDDESDVEMPSNKAEVARQKSMDQEPKPDPFELVTGDNSVTHSSQGQLVTGDNSVTHSSQGQDAESSNGITEDTTSKNNKPVLTQSSVSDVDNIHSDDSRDYCSQIIPVIEFESQPVTDKNGESQQIEEIAGESQTVLNIVGESQTVPELDKTSHQILEKVRESNEHFERPGQTCHSQPEQEITAEDGKYCENNGGHQLACQPETNKDKVRDQPMLRQNIQHGASILSYGLSPFSRPSPSESDRSIVQDSVTDEENISIEKLPQLYAARIDATKDENSDKTSKDLSKETQGILEGCTFDDTMTDMEDDDNITDIVHFLDDETVYYGDRCQDEQVSDDQVDENCGETETCSSSQTSEGRDSNSPVIPIVTASFTMTSNIESPASVLRQTPSHCIMGDMASPIITSQNSSQTFLRGDNLKNNFETSTPLEAERASLMKLKDLERTLAEKAQQQKEVKSNVPSLSQKTETTILYQDHDSLLDDNEDQMLCQQQDQLIGQGHDGQNDNQACSVAVETQGHQMTVEGTFGGEHIQTNVMECHAVASSCHGDESDHDSEYGGTPLSIHFSLEDSDSFMGSSLGNVQNVNVESTSTEDEHLRNMGQMQDRPAVYNEQEAHQSFENLQQQTPGHIPSQSYGSIVQRPEGDAIDTRIGRENFQAPLQIDIPKYDNSDSFAQGQNENLVSLSQIKLEMSPNEIMPKRKAQDLLEKLKAKKAKLTLPKSTASVARTESPARVPQPAPRVDNAEHLNRCKDLIKNLMSCLTKDTDVHNPQRIQAWKREFHELNEKLSLPKMTVAVVGSTGAGKSSLMNAVINHDILPTSGTQACTAVVVEIENNDHSDLFEAEIEFLSKEEWEHEFQILKRDLTTKSGKLKKFTDPESEAGVAHLKMRAVYGKFDSLDKITRPTIVTRYLGRREKMTAFSAAEFRSKINKFIGNTGSESSGGQYWPIIKRVKIRIPQCDVCSSGCTLVDLPGVRDSNAARDRIAKDYLKNCSVILIVADVHRAISDKTAKDLLGENFRRQLLMDGKYGNVAIICTKNDDVKPSELISELKLQDQVRHIETALRSMKQKVNDLSQSKDNLQLEIAQIESDIYTLASSREDQVRDIQQIESLVSLVETQEETEMLEDLRNDLEKTTQKIHMKNQNVEGKRRTVQDMEHQILQLEISITTKQKELKTECAKARKEATKTNIKQDYRTGIREMKRKAKLTQEQIEEYEEDDFSDDETEEELTKSCDNLQVFCVSSAEYQKLKNEEERDGNPTVFDTLDDTEIPAVRQYIQQISSERQREATQRILHNVASAIFDVQNYLTENGLTSKQDRFTVKSAVEDFSTRLMQELVPVLDRIGRDVMTAVNSRISVNLNRGVAVAIKSAKDTAVSWGCHPKDGGYCFPTYKATVNRHGEFKSPALNKEINYNEELAKPINTSISIVWTRFFGSELWQVIEKGRSLIMIELRKFTNKLIGELATVNVTTSQLQNTQRQFLKTAQNKLTEMMRTLRDFVDAEQRNISRVFSPVVKEYLDPVYDDCLNDSGQGFFKRMKNKLETGVDTKKKEMFSEASSQLLTQLTQLMEDVIGRIKAVCTELCTCLQTSFEPLWNSSESAKQLKTTLFEAITEATLDISTICRTVGVQLETRAVTPHGHSSIHLGSPSNSYPFSAGSASASNVAVRAMEMPGCSYSSPSQMTEVHENQAMQQASFLPRTAMSQRVVELPGCSGISRKKSTDHGNDNKYQSNQTAYQSFGQTTTRGIVQPIKSNVSSDNKAAYKCASSTPQNSGQFSDNNRMASPSSIVLERATDSSYVMKMAQNLAHPLVPDRVLQNREPKLSSAGKNITAAGVSPRVSGQSSHAFNAVSNNGSGPRATSATNSQTMRAILMRPQIQGTSYIQSASTQALSPLSQKLSGVTQQNNQQPQSAPSAPTIASPIRHLQQVVIGNQRMPILVPLVNNNNAPVNAPNQCMPNLSPVNLPQGVRFVRPNIQGQVPMSANASQSSRTYSGGQVTRPVVSVQNPATIIQRQSPKPGAQNMSIVKGILANTSQPGSSGVSRHQQNVPTPLTNPQFQSQNQNLPSNTKQYRFVSILPKDNTRMPAQNLPSALNNSRNTPKGNLSTEPSRLIGQGRGSIFETPAQPANQNTGHVMPGSSQPVTREVASTHSPSGPEVQGNMKDKVWGIGKRKVTTSQPIVTQPENTIIPSIKEEPSVKRRRIRNQNPVCITISDSDSD